MVKRHRAAMTFHSFHCVPKHWVALVTKSAGSEYIVGYTYPEETSNSNGIETMEKRNQHSEI
jgi:hypothetical protein